MENKLAAICVRKKQNSLNKFISGTGQGKKFTFFFFFSDLYVILLLFIDMLDRPCQIIQFQYLFNEKFVKILFQAKTGFRTMP